MHNTLQNNRIFIEKGQQTHRGLPGAEGAIPESRPPVILQTSLFKLHSSTSRVYLPFWGKQNLAGGSIDYRQKERNS